MNEPLQLASLYVEELVFSDDLHVCHQESRLKARASDPVLDLHTGDPNFVHQVTMFGDQRMVGLAPQDVDRA